MLFTHTIQIVADIDNPGRGVTLGTTRGPPKYLVVAPLNARVVSMPPAGDTPRRAGRRSVSDQDWVSSITGAGWPDPAAAAAAAVTWGGVVFSAAAAAHPGALTARLLSFFCFLLFWRFSFWWALSLFVGRRRRLPGKGRRLAPDWGLTTREGSHFPWCESVPRKFETMARGRKPPPNSRGLHRIHPFIICFVNEERVALRFTNYHHRRQRDLPAASAPVEQNVGKIKTHCNVSETKKNNKNISARTSMNRSVNKKIQFQNEITEES